MHISLYAAVSPNVIGSAIGFWYVQLYENVSPAFVVRKFGAVQKPSAPWSCPEPAPHAVRPCASATPATDAALPTVMLLHRIMIENPPRCANALCSLEL